MDGLRTDGWNEEAIIRVKILDNKCTRVTKFWVERIKEGYLVEVTIECNKFFCSMERKFEANHRGRLLVEILFWIKMLLVENGLILMDP